MQDEVSFASMHQALKIYEGAEVNLQTIKISTLAGSAYLHAPLTSLRRKKNVAGYVL
jgi:hypothetical protein